MTKQKFDILNTREQVDELYAKGVYIGKQTLQTTVVLLYQLESFYVEVHYLKFRLHVGQIVCSDSTEILNPYLLQINLSELNLLLA